MRKIKKQTDFVILKQPDIDENAIIPKNEIGEVENTWADAVSFSGVLGLQSGDSKYSSFNAKIEESTHVMVCDFNKDIYSLGKTNTRLRAKGMIYDVLLIDNPDELDIQLEIYLRLVGGQNG